MSEIEPMMDERGQFTLPDSGLNMNRKNKSYWPVHYTLIPPLLGRDLRPGEERFSRSNP